jgi:hypothetical protein
MVLPVLLKEEPFSVPVTLIIPMKANIINAM